MSISAPVLALLIDNMLDQPEVFAAHWSAVDSATAVFLTCKTLRQLRSAWNRSSVAFDACENAAEHFPLLMYLALRRQRTMFCSANTLLFGAAVRARLADRNAVTFALTPKSNGLDNFMRVAGAWLLHQHHARDFAIHITKPTAKDVAVQLQTGVGLVDVHGFVRLYIPRAHVFLPQLPDFGVTLSHNACRQFIEMIVQWKSMATKDDIRCALVFIFERNAHGALQFFEVFNEQSYARVNIQLHEQ